MAAFSELPLEPDFWTYLQTTPVYASYTLVRRNPVTGEEMSELNYEDVKYARRTTFPVTESATGFATAWSLAAQYWFLQDALNHERKGKLPVPGPTQIVGPGEFHCTFGLDVTESLEGCTIQVFPDADSTAQKRLGNNSVIGNFGWLAFTDDVSAERPQWLNATAQKFEAIGKTQGILGFVKEGNFLAVTPLVRPKTELSYKFNNTLAYLQDNPGGYIQFGA